MGRGSCIKLIKTGCSWEGNSLIFKKSWWSISYTNDPVWPQFQTLRAENTTHSGVF